MEEQHCPSNGLPPQTTNTQPASEAHAEGTSSEVAASEHIPETPVEAVPAPFPLDLEAPLLVQEAPDPSPTRQPSRHQPWQALPRRQVLLGAVIVVGAAAIGTGTTLARLFRPSTPRSSSASISPSGSQLPSTATVKPLPTQTPVSEDTLRAWRTRHLTVQPSQRFQHHSGTGIVPLAVLEPTYPNPFNPY